MRTLPLILSSLFALVPLLSGCGAGANKQAAEDTAAKFYEASSRKDWNAALDLYSADFYGKTSRDQWQKMLLGLHDKFGDYKSRELKNWSYQSFSGIGGSTQTIVLIYQVQYEKGEATETLTFVNKGDDKSSKITGHQINSPLLLMSGSADSGAGKKSGP